MFLKLFLFTILFSNHAWSSYDAANRTYGNGSFSFTENKRIILDLVESEYYFSLIPWIKEYVFKSNHGLEPEIDKAIDKMIYHTGVKPFESLPDEVLKKSRSAAFRYILSKRLLKRGKSSDALKELIHVSEDHYSSPFISNLKGVIFSDLNQTQEARIHFNECLRSSNKRIQETESVILKNQLYANRDYCLAGVARSYFATKEYINAELVYLDISKESFVWPEILFEEAWTSYYLKNYNRTLGKLVSYRAPVFDFIFKPEIEVLTALSYLRMCLYEDAKKTTDDFYRNLLSPSRELRDFIINRGKDYKIYYSLMADFEDNKALPVRLIENILKSVSKDAAYLEMKSALLMSIVEYKKLEKQQESRMNVDLVKNIRTVVDEYRVMIGAYVRSSLVSKYAELYSAFQDMSYIKLEVLAQRKEKLYNSELNQDKKRGDVKYIEKNNKQYFWTFNGEFWADELGDYVFALRSEC
jgi:hypothetical protein